MGRLSPLRTRTSSLPNRPSSLPNRFLPQGGAFDR